MLKLKSDSARDPVEAVRRSLEAMAADDLQEATAHLAAAQQIAPSSPALAHALALVALRVGEPAKALELLQQAHEAAPDAREHADALAIVHAKLGRLHDSLYYAKLGVALDPAYADLALNPPWLGDYSGNFAAMEERPLLNEGNARLRAGDYAKAIELFRKDVELERESIPTWRGLAVALRRGGRPYDSLVAYRALRTLAPDDVDDLSALATALTDTGKHDEALACHERAVRMAPDRRDVASAMLADLARTPGVRRDALADRQRVWGRGSPEPVGAPSAPSEISGRPLRVGFLSGRFRESQGLDAVLSLLALPRKPLWEAYCYSNNPFDDGLTRRLRNAVEGWRDIGELDDDTATVIVRNDNLDVLIDLDGHREFGRSALAGLKPAPRTVLMFGLPEAAADQGYDAVLGDDWIYPAAQEAAPAIIRIPGGLFRVPVDRPVSRVARLHADRAVAFGVRTRRSAVTGDMVARWADVLSAVPGSVLVVDAVRLGGASGFAEIKAQLARHGMAERLRQFGTSVDTGGPVWTANVDVVLDAGASSSLDDVVDALSQGQPIVTLAGDRPESRVAASLLSSLGFDDCAATEPARFVATAVGLARDPAVLSGTARRLIERLKDAQSRAEREGTAAFGRAIGEWLNSRIAIEKAKQ